jgi:pyrimidine deaminase RibD-like protein
MSRALELAARGLYTTDPNPRVGCVLVRDGTVSARAGMCVPARRMPKCWRCARRAPPRAAPPPT